MDVLVQYAADHDLAAAHQRMAAFSPAVTPATVRDAAVAFFTTWDAVLGVSATDGEQLAKMAHAARGGLQGEQVRAAGPAAAMLNLEQPWKDDVDRSVARNCIAWLTAIQPDFDRLSVDKVLELLGRARKRRWGADTLTAELYNAAGIKGRQGPRSASAIASARAATRKRRRT
ncbi:MAG: hypothetical protein WKG00_18260 [Polyangiaceae bacterium]